jgi:DNA polymerase-3 subunit gamma/tau
MAWRKYAYIAKDKGLDTLFSALTSADPLLEDGYVIKLNVSNEVQKNFVDTHETDVLTYLRQTLENYEITLVTEVGQESSDKKQLYSGQDKFKDMAERNPHLKTLQQRFKLDIEF